MVQHEQTKRKKTKKLLSNERERDIDCTPSLRPGDVDRGPTVVGGDHFVPQKVPTAAAQLAVCSR